MLRNYLTVAWRNLRRRPGFSALNVIGLAAGLTCVILIGLWVKHELSYDDFHPNAERTYRVLRTTNAPGPEGTTAGTPSALAPTLDEQYAQIETVVRVRERTYPVERRNQTRVESNLLYADPGFFDVFGFELQQGTARLQAPGTIVLTPELANRYFPNESPIGRTLQVKGNELEVTGIVAPPPSNTHLNYAAVVSLATASPENRWHCQTDQTYLKLQSSTAEDAFADRLREVAATHEDDPETAGLDVVFSLQPITGIHLRLGAPSGLPSEGSLAYVLLFSALAVFVLLLACINFMNLSTARSAERANEVGVRKAMGAGRGQLAGQFLGESFLMTGLALIVAVGSSAALLPTFNHFAGTSIARTVLLSGPYLGAYAGLLLVVGLAAGSYPALALSGYRPIETLRAWSSSERGSPRLRQALIVFQFAISIALIAGTAVVNKQLTYLQSKGLGFEEDNVLVVHDETGPLGNRLDAFTQALESHAAVGTAAAGAVIEEEASTGTWVVEEEASPDSLSADFSAVGYDYVETLGIEVIAGRSFSRAHPADTAGVVINQSAVEAFGFSSPQRALGETLGIGLYSGLPIIGVVRDFHYKSLHKKIAPLVLMHEAIMLPPRRIAVRIQPEQKAAAIEAVRSTWESFSGLPFDYTFLADDLAAQYEAEQRTGSLMALFAGLALLIACLGLFGLAAHAAQQRTKEIAIRKAMGATARRIVGLLSKDFLILVGLAFAVAVPVAYVALRRWLQDFAYHADLGLGLFLLAGGTVLLVALLTVSTQAWRAAQTDLATALRQE